MRKKYLKQICAMGLVSMISLVACQETFLEKAPIGSTSEVNMATKTGVDYLLIGAYNSLKMDNQASGNTLLNNCNNLCFSMFGTNEFVRGFSSIPELAHFEQHQVDPTNNPSVNGAEWKLGYDGIQRANTVLRVLARVPEGQLTDKEINQIKGEAIFLRAVLHFELAKFYLHIPYVDESITFGAGNYNVPNTESIWPKIEADFQFAANNLAPTNADRGRANSWAAKCFLAEVYMQQHKYAEALPLLTDAINNGVTAGGQKYALNQLYFDNFDCKKKNSAESVFAVQFNVPISGQFILAGNSGIAVCAPLVPACSGSGFAAATRSTVNTFKTDAVTGLPLFDTYDDFDIPDNSYIADDEPFTPYEGTIDSRLDNSLMRRGIPLLDWGMPVSSWCYNKAIQGTFMLKKYFFYQADKDIYAESMAWDYVTSDNYDMIRFADVLLLAAECEVEAGSLANAESYVNMVRARAANPAGWVKTYNDPNNPSAGFTNTPAANYKVGLYAGQFTGQGKEYARKAVRFERRLELAFEGHYFADLQRWDNGTGYMADQINHTIQHEMLQPAVHAPNLRSVRFIKGKHELYPIPQSQIDQSTIGGNPTLVQNPGY